LNKKLIEIVLSQVVLNELDTNIFRLNCPSAAELISGTHHMIRRLIRAAMGPGRSLRTMEITENS